MSFRARLIDYFRSRNRGWVLSLFVATCVLYLPFLGSPFVFDDVLFFYGGIAKNYAHTWFHFDLRWLSYATLAWTEAAFSNVATHTFHLGNMLLHAANVVLLFYLLRQLAAAAIPSNNQAVAWGAWFGALIFALHPVSVYAAGYVVERSILMATTFSLAMQLAWLRGLLGGGARWLALTVAFYFLALFSKEHSVLMPAVLAAEAIMLRGKIRATRPALVTTAGALAAAGVLVALIVKGVFGTPYEPMAAALFEQHGVAAAGDRFVLHLLSVLTQAGLFFKYLLLWVAPNPAWMAVDMREPFVSSLGAWQGWLGGACFAAYGVAAFWLLLRPGRAALAGLALLFPWLMFLPEFSTIRVQEVFVLYRSYLWMPGLMLLVPFLLAGWQGRKALLAFGAIVLLLAPLAANRLWVFADNFRLWNDAALLLQDEQVPGADRIFFNRGQAEESIGKLDAAVADFRRVIAVSPQYAPVHFELGWVYLRLGRYDEAMQEFDAALSRDPGYGNAYYGKALLLKRKHEDAQARELMAKACELKHGLACLIVKGHIEH